MKKEIFKSDIGESYVKVTHPSGLKIYVLEKSGFKSTYALFGTKYGSIDTAFSRNGQAEITVPEGIAHFLEHKLFESEDGDAFSRFAVTGASANAYTSFDRTCYLFSCGDKFYENLEILLDFVQHPYFTEDTVRKEQGIIGQEIRMYDDNPGWCVFFNLLSALYVNHPVKIDIAGTVESIAKIDANLLYECYNTFYNPQNMFLCVAGNVKAEEVLLCVEKGLKEKQPISIMRSTFNEPDNLNKDYTEQSAEVSIPLFAFGFKEACPEPLKTLKERIAMSIALEILAGDSSSLYKKLTENELINDEFDTEYFTGYGYASIIFSGESKNPRAVKEEIISTVESIVKNGFDKSVFERVKRAFYGDAVRRFNSVDGIATQLVECAMCDYDLFSELEILSNIEYDDIYKSFLAMQKEKSALSVILPSEK